MPINLMNCVDNDGNRMDDSLNNDDYFRLVNPIQDCSNNKPELNQS